MFLSGRIARFFLLAFVASAAALRGAEAQISFSTPDNSTVPLAHCQEYFSYEWNQPLDMSGPDNGPLNYVPAGETREIDAFSYSGGILSFNSTGPSPVLTFLQTLPFDPSTQTNAAIPIGSRYGEVHPINPSLYHNFVVRMNSSSFTTATIIWGMNTQRFAGANFQVFPGWHTYEIDMNSVTVLPIAGSNLNWTAGQWQYLVMQPTNSSGVAINIDYVMLESDVGCGSGDISFTANAQGADDRFAVVVDTDGDLSNGVETSAIGPVAGSQVYTIGGSGADIAIAKLHPGTHNVYGFLSGDWATLTMLDPWDMSSATDVNMNQVFNISNISFSGGAMNGTVTTGDPNIFLNLRGNTIDASIYKQLSIGISYTFPGGVNHDSLDVLFFDVNGAFLGQKQVSGSTNSGSNVYTASLGPSDGWSGQIGGIRIDPTNSNQAIGTTFALDFVALRDSGFVSSLALPSLVSAPANLVVNNPTLTFLQPDQRGGRDFAQTTLGKAWNMNSIGDVPYVTNVSTAQIYPNDSLVDQAGNVNAGDFFREDNITGNGDPQIVLLENAPASQRVNTQTFLNMCFRAFNKTDSGGYNSIARFIYHNPAIATPTLAYTSGDDIIMNRGSKEYCLDLAQSMFARTEPLTPNGGNAWTAISASGSAADVVRIDLNEEEEPFWSVLDYLHLRTDHEANTQYAISIQAPLTEAVDLYYVPAGGGSQTFIATMAPGRNTNTYLWNTASMAEGKYNIVGQVVANGNTFVVHAPGRIDISHSRAQDTTAPILNCERPGDGYTFDTSLEVAGYALDDTRLASVEVAVDGNYFTNFQPDKFHLGARNQYPNYAESSNSGFQNLFDATSIADGAHTVMMTAYDTAGNTSSCSFSVTRTPGANPAPLTYPPNNDASIAVPIFVPTPVPDPKVKVVISAKAKATYTVTGAGRCDSVTLYAGTNANLAGAVTLFSTAGKTTLIASTATVPLFSRPRKSKETGILYLKARCATGEISPAVKMNLTHVRSKKVLMTEKKILTYLHAHVKVM